MTTRSWYKLSRKTTNWRPVCSHNDCTQQRCRSGPSGPVALKEVKIPWAHSIANLCGYFNHIRHSTLGQPWSHTCGNFVFRWNPGATCSFPNRLCAHISHSLPLGTVKANPNSIFSLNCFLIKFHSPKLLNKFPIFFLKNKVLRLKKGTVEMWMWLSRQGHL